MKQKKQTRILVQSTLNKKPETGITIAFYYNHEWHVGCLLNDENSDVPENWEWYSKEFKRGFYCIIEPIKWWFELPEISQMCD